MKRSVKALVFVMAMIAACFAAAPSAWAAEARTYALGEEPAEVSISVSEGADEDGDDLAAVPMPAEVPADKSLQPGDNVWVNGKTGDDANPGTESYPVKTFVRAKELVEQCDSEIIWVTGALQVSGTTETWDLGGKMIMRDGEYHGALVEVKKSGSLTLQNIVIDGGLSNGAFGWVDSGVEGNGASLVDVNKGTLTIKGGAKLQNNRIASTNHWYPDGGGGVFAQNGTVNLDGGIITGNSAVYGGGILAMYDSTVNVYSGEITGNKAVEGTNKEYAEGTNKDYSGCGGGICVYFGADVNVSGGTISNNSAFERGGGISVGCYTAFYGADHSVLKMSGGTISGNKAGSSGGGIFVQAGFSGKDGAGRDYGVPGYSIAYVTAGDIIDNAVTGTGYGSTEFGGGGIYVNGYTSAYAQLHNGELYLEKAVVSDNTAGLVGGGYAGCPVSLTEVTLANGSVFYGNKTDSGEAREIYVQAHLGYGAHSGDPTYLVSPSMLGGGAYRWVYDDGTEVPLNKLSGILSAQLEEELRLSNALDASDAGVQKAAALATVHITGNSAPKRGGGIGSNGTVFIGKAEKTTEVSASKSWIDADNKDKVRPESVIFELYRDGEYVGYQTVTPNDDGVWETVFTELPKADEDGHEYVYTVKERDVEGYASEVAGDATEGFSVFNTRVTSVGVIKKWDDAEDTDGKRPASVTVDLLRDGVKVDSATIGADEDGDWRHTFTGLTKYDSEDDHEYVYTVEEQAVEGYESKVEGSAADGFTITNTKKENPPTPEEPDTPEEPEQPEEPDAPEEPEKPEESKRGLPQTGDVLSAALAMVTAAGVVAVAGGALFRFRLGKQDK